MKGNVEVSTVPRKAYSYIRFSGKRQEAGHSEQRQKEMAEEAAKAEGVPLDWSLSLGDRGLSGYRGENWRRGALGKFIDLVDAGIIPPGSVLIIERVNRLSRLPWMEQVQLWKEILRRGIIIRTCEPASRYSSENMNELAVGCPVVIYMMMAHQESKQKSEWVKAVWKEKKKQAQAEGVPHGRMRPHWIDAITAPHPKDPERIVTTGYALNKDRAATVRFIFETAIAGKGASRIGSLLRERGIPSFQRSDWTPACIRNILKSRVAFGEYQPTEKDASGKSRPVGKPVPGYYPAAISEDEYHAAQAALRSRRGKGGRQSEGEVNLFTHLVFDADDGTSLHSMTQVQKGRQYRYLATKNRNQIVPYPQFERIMLDTLDQLKRRDVDGRHEEDALTARVNTLQDEFQRLGHELEALDMQIRELPPERWPKRVVVRMSELEEKIAAKKEELRQAKEAANTSGRSDSLQDLQTAIKLLSEVQGTSQETSVRQRIKLRVRLLVEAVLLKVERVTLHNRFVHVWCYLHGREEPLYWTFELGNCKDVDPSEWQFLPVKNPRR